MSDLSGDSDRSAEHVSPTASDAGTPPPLPPPKGAMHPLPSGSPLPPPFLPNPVAPFTFPVIKVLAFGLLFAGLLVGLITAGVVLPPCYRAHNHAVFLVNGLDVPYEVRIGETSYTVSNEAPLELKLSEDEYSISAKFPEGYQPSFAEKVDLRTNFKTRLRRGKITVINPDKLALICREVMVYSLDKNTTEKGDLAFFPNESVMHLDSPNYAFQDFPDEVELPSPIRSTRKTRVTAVSGFGAQTMLSTIKLHNSTTQASKYALRVGQFFPEDSWAIAQARQYLEPGDWAEFFALHLDTRPVLAEWHRMYQEYEKKNKDMTSDGLVAKYRAYLEKEPEDGEFYYLLGRLVKGKKQADEYYEKALKAAKPSKSVWNALGYENASDGNFAEALQCAEKGLEVGCLSASLPSLRRDMLLALGQPGEAFSDLQKAFTTNGDDLEMAERVALLAGRCGRSKAKADEFIAIAKYYAEAENGEKVQNSIMAAYAYGKGDVEMFIRESGKTAWPRITWQNAVSQKQHDRAAAMIKDSEVKESATSWLTLYITAHLAKDMTAAEGYFAKAVGALSYNDDWDNALNQPLLSKQPVDAEAMIARLGTPSDKRVLCCALGLRYPAQREAYFRGARRMNFAPDFPKLLLDEALAVNDTK